MGTHVVRLMFSVSVAMVIVAGLACAQDYPNRPVRIVTSSVGTGADFLARLIAQGISGSLGQPTIVDNRGSGIIPGQVTARSSPDGYTALIGGSGLWLGQFLLDVVPFDYNKDFAPVSILNRASQLLVVVPSVPVTSVKELIAYAKAKPGTLNYTSGSTGSTGHLAAELFAFLTGVNLVRVSYKSSSQEIADLLAGQVQMTFTSNPATTQHVKSGKLKALAHTGDQASLLYPGLPTVAASVPGYRMETILVMFVPAKTPAAAIKRLNEVTTRVLNTPEAKERLFLRGTEAVGSSQEEAVAAVKAEIALWGKVIKAAGIKAE